MPCMHGEYAPVFFNKNAVFFNIMQLMKHTGDFSCFMPKKAGSNQKTLFVLLLLLFLPKYCFASELATFVL